VSILKPIGYSVKHLTFLDMVARPPAQDRGDADPQLQRAISYMTVTLPNYSRTPVFIDSAPGERDLLCSWSPPGPPVQPFPNPDRFRVDVGNNPAELNQFLNVNDGDLDFCRPARATATTLYAHWMGGLNPAWGTIRATTSQSQVDVVPDETGQEILLGTLVHDLPGELKNITFIWVKGSRKAMRRYARSGDVEEAWVPYGQSGTMLNNGRVWRLSNESWPPGTPWRLQDKLGKAAGTSRGRDEDEIEKGFEDRWFTDYARPGLGLPGPSQRITESDETKYLEMLSLFNQLEPPKYLASGSGRSGEDNVAFSRMLGREVDLSSWFTRPCLIILAHLEGTDLPFPLSVAGQTPEADPDSLIVVRWVCPLEMDETMERVAFRGSTDAQTPGEPDAGRP
jgi:hypothetical protein